MTLNFMFQNFNIIQDSRKKQKKLYHLCLIACCVINIFAKSIFWCKSNSTKNNQNQFGVVYGKRKSVSLLEGAWLVFSFQAWGVVT